MKMVLKRIACVVLCITLTATMAVTAFAAQASAKLYNVYGDKMLLRQNEEAVFAGTGTAGSTVSCELIGENDSVLRQANSVVDSSGKFELSFTAPSGGYTTYTVKFYVDATEFCTLNDVVFGELWLASGQSNMQYSLNQSDTYEQNKVCSEWLRFLYIEPYPTYKGNAEEIPLEAQEDIEQGSCRWMKGTDNLDDISDDSDDSDDLGGISAVSFFFAQELQKKLDMPVGVLMPNLGGSILASWLSRETIDSDTEFANYLKEKNMYVSAEDWDTGANVWHSTITSNYNKKIPPLRNFSISGMIWYQGETEILLNWEIGYYKRGLELLQSSYSELFGCESKLAFIATQVAPYAYGKNKCNLHNNEFVDFQTEDPTSRAVTTIYDLSLDYDVTAGAIHPCAKQPIGERLAACADGLVYGNSDCYTAATVQSVRVDGSDLYVTLRDVGDGLVADGALRGFALCEEGGVYVQASAEIVGDNTIKIHSDEVKKPVGATYAFAQNNNSANVYSTLNEKKFMPVAPFTTNIKGDKLYWEDPAWANCDSESAWILSGDNHAGINKLWSAENAVISIDSDTQFGGEGCLNVVSDANSREFSVSPVYTYTQEKDEKYFDSALTNWSNYSAVSVMVRNNGKSDVTLDKMRIYTSKLTWYAPQLDDSGEPGAVIPADGQWHKLTFDLDSLYLFGNECGATYSRRKLGNIKSFELKFAVDKKQSCDISVDEFRFTADASEGSYVRFDTSISKADSVFEFISALFVTVLSAIFGLFK